MKREVAVWDIWVRLFHWTLIALIGFSWLSAELGGNWMIWHTQAGFITAGLIVFRVIWGIAGSWSARFTTFVRPPSRVLAYLRGEDSSEHLSHNPIGALGVLALITLIALQVITGLFSNDDIFIEGPLAYLVSYDTSLEITDLHEGIFNLLLAIVALHIAAVMYHQKIRKEPIVQAMVHGRKPAHKDVPELKTPVAVLVVALTTGVGISVWLFSLG